NRTVKPLSADDSTDTRAKVGHRQAPHQGPQYTLGAFVLLHPSSRAYDRLHRVCFRAKINLTSSVFFVAHDCQNQMYVFEYRSIVRRRTVGHVKANIILAATSKPNRCRKRIKKPSTGNLLTAFLL
ncbi:hypothetical protein, partial [Laribacter hongkongensis]|uniref:hypothetical protein n=1 Tax=Laribacter hongkongensis TaxID=168471 RepID=UPI001EFD8444